MTDQQWTDKRCPRCGMVLPPEDFGRCWEPRAGGRRILRLQSWCKECARTRRESAAAFEDKAQQGRIATELGLSRSRVTATMNESIRRLWNDRRLRAIYLAKHQGKIPEDFRL